MTADAVVHIHTCEDHECQAPEPWPGVEHDAFCVWLGFCLRCEVLHRNHCSCDGRGPSDSCSLDRTDLTERHLDDAHHGAFRWPPLEVSL